MIRAIGPTDRQLDIRASHADRLIYSHSNYLPFNMERFQSFVLLLFVVGMLASNTVKAASVAKFSSKAIKDDEFVAATGINNNVRGAKKN